MNTPKMLRLISASLPTPRAADHHGIVRRMKHRMDICAIRGKRLDHLGDRLLKIAAERRGIRYLPVFRNLPDYLPSRRFGPLLQLAKNQVSRIQGEYWREVQGANALFYRLRLRFDGLNSQCRGLHRNGFRSSVHRLGVR